MPLSGHQVVSGHHNGSASPFVVATSAGQRGSLVRMLLHDPDPDYPDVHASTYFYVSDRSIMDYGAGEWPDRWLRIGFHEGFGGALFYDGAEHDRSDHADWAWIALAAEPRTDPPTVYFDQDGELAFPPAAVMPLERVRDVVLEWVRTGERPASVRWLTVNTLVWQLSEDGRLIP